MFSYPPRPPGGDELRHVNEDRYPDDKWHITASEVLGDSFDKSKNPVFARSAILLAYDAGIVPPVWAMDWLAAGLRSYLDSEGHEDIAQALGLRADGRGKAQPVQAHFADLRRQWMACSIYILNCAFSVPIGEAASMVWVRKHGAGGDPDGKKAGWLAEQYRRRWRKKFEGYDRKNKELGGPGFMEQYKEEKNRREFLESFPASVIPYGLK